MSVVELHQYPSIWGLSSLSPFCIKVEAYLKYYKVPYNIVEELNPKNGPRGKMPYIIHKGHEISDSSLIVEYLNHERKVGKMNYTDSELSVAFSFKTMLEESFYFILLYSRWVDSNGFSSIKKDFTDLFLPGIGKYFIEVIRRSLISQANKQGIGRFSSTEVYRMGRQQLSSISEFLGDKDFFLGSEISDIDFSLYGFFITLLKSPLETELYQYFRKNKRLVDYTERMDYMINASTTKI